MTVVKLEWKLRKFNRCKRIEMKTALIAFSAILYFPSATGLANMDKTQLFCLIFKKSNLAATDCQLVGIDYAGNDKSTVDNIESWQACG